MDGRAMIPLIDMVFLTLGSILALLTQMRMVEAMDINLVRVGPGGAVTDVEGDFVTIVIDATGIRHDGKRITLDALPEAVGDARQVVLRVDAAATGEATIQAMAALGRLGVEVRPEVSTRPGPEPSGQGTNQRGNAAPRATQAANVGEGK